MALTLTPTQREKARKGFAKIPWQGKEIKVWGTIGTLEYFGFEPEPGSVDIDLSGISRTVSRPAGKRSRWLGDSNGVAFKASTSNQAFYPSRRGVALPGAPVTLEVVETGDTWTLNVDGPIGGFISYLGNNRPGFDVQIRGKTGNRYIGVLQETEPQP
jgi:hypothetical protein